MWSHWSGFGIESRGSSRIESHAEAYFNHPQTKLLAVCDSDKDSLKDVAKGGM